MSQTSDAIFIQQFEAELFEAFQNQGGAMRSRLRRKTGVVGTRTHFPKIGLAPAAQPKTRNGKVPLLDIVRDRVQCDLTDYYGADMIDSLDELKTNVDEKSGGPALAPWLTVVWALTDPDATGNQVAGAIRRSIWFNNLIYVDWLFRALAREAGTAMQPEPAGRQPAPALPGFMGGRQ